MANIHYTSQHFKLNGKHFTLKTSARPTFMPRQVSTDFGTIVAPSDQNTVLPPGVINGNYNLFWSGPPYEWHTQTQTTCRWPPRRLHWTQGHIQLSRLRPQKNGWHFAGDAFFWMKIFFILIQISMKFLELTINHHWFRETEREIKFIGLFGDRGHRGPYSPHKPCNHWFSYWPSPKEVTTHYLNQCWSSSIIPYSITSSQWVKLLCTDLFFQYLKLYTSIFYIFHTGMM